MRLTEKTGPVWVDGVFYNGPVSLEQMIGKTIDPMEEQPRGNYMMPPISYWNKRERLARNPRHCESTYDLSLCSNNPFVCGDYTTKRAIARRIKREDLRK
jgi:hypothetical protein